MSQPPSTPIKLPVSATTYTPATLDPDTRSQINTLLLRDGHINKIQDALLHSLHAHPSNWPSTVQQHALSILRSQEATTFPALIKKVLEDVRHDSQQAQERAAETNGATTNGNGNKVNGNNLTSSSTGSRGGEGNLAIPQAVVDEVLRITKECLKEVCEVDGEST